jgi:hypothetical protein
VARSAPEATAVVISSARRAVQPAMVLAAARRVTRLPRRRLVTVSRGDVTTAGRESRDGTGRRRGGGRGGLVKTAAIGPRPAMAKPRSLDQWSIPSRVMAGAGSREPRQCRHSARKLLLMRPRDCSADRAGVRSCQDSSMFAWRWQGCRGNGDSGRLRSVRQVRWVPRRQQPLPGCQPVAHPPDPGRAGALDDSRSRCCWKVSGRDGVAARSRREDGRADQVSDRICWSSLPVLAAGSAWRQSCSMTCR